MESTNRTKPVEEMLQNYNREDPFPGKEALWQKIEAGQAEASPPARPKRRVVRRAVLAAALLVAIVTTTVFADDIAEAVRQLVHGDITVEEYETLTLEFDGTAIDNRMYYEGIESFQPLTEEQHSAVWDAWQTEFDTAEELQAQLPFPIRPPAAPKGYEVSKMVGYSLPDGHFLEYVWYSYCPEGQDTAAGNYVKVTQMYVGPNCTLKLQTVESLDNVQLFTINGHEAVFTPTMGLFWLDGDLMITVWGPPIVLAEDAEEAVRFAEAMYA